ncbi:hypothetical protein AKJ16_DCAP18914 [Drosera capensis]
MLLISVILLAWELTDGPGFVAGIVIGMVIGDKTSYSKRRLLVSIRKSNPGGKVIAAAFATSCGMYNLGGRWPFISVNLYCSLWRTTCGLS